MLKGISPLISPDLLLTLSAMGHGDDIVFADAHFPGQSCNPNCLRADGLKVADLLDAILPLFELDSYVDAPAVMIAPAPGDDFDPGVKKRLAETIARHQPNAPAIAEIDRFSFYDQSRNAFAVVMTGDTVKYGCIILKKGVTPC